MNSFDYYNWIILPLIIFASRIGDVTLGTLRHVLMARGHKSVAPLLGFFEVLIWIIIVSQIMKQANNFACYIAWAGGFAMGNYIGLLIEEKIALGLQIIRIISHQDCEELITKLQSANHGTTVVDAQGAKGPVKIILTVVKRKNIDPIIHIIQKYNPDAFYSIEDIRDVNRGVFSKSNQSSLRQIFSSKK
ncbi:MAG: DUF2179 domain-containing protein [Bacteroidetes bacterium]|nr:MAG: DUF2179 domain-containing protein [Bacteroidota bacterium]